MVLRPPTRPLPDLSSPLERRRFARLFTARVADDALLGPVFGRPQEPAQAEYEWWERALAGHCYLGRPPHGGHWPCSEAQVRRWRQLLTATFRSAFAGPQAAEAEARLLNEAAMRGHWQLTQRHRPAPALRQAA
ncbi:hypothetical protein GCM10027048_21100 [Hymenobacter coalescens]